MLDHELTLDSMHLLVYIWSQAMQQLQGWCTGWPRLQAACLQHGSRDAMHPSSRPCLDGEAPLSELHDLGQRLRAPWANAWSLNIVYAQPTDVKRAGCVIAPYCSLLSAPRPHAAEHMPVGGTWSAWRQSPLLRSTHVIPHSHALVKSLSGRLLMAAREFCRDAHLAKQADRAAGPTHRQPAAARWRPCMLCCLHRDKRAVPASA